MAVQPASPSDRLLQFSHAPDADVFDMAPSTSSPSAGTKRKASPEASEASPPRAKRARVDERPDARLLMRLLDISAEPPVEDQPADEWHAAVRADTECMQSIGRECALAVNVRISRTDTDTGLAIQRIRVRVRWRRARRDNELVFALSWSGGRKSVAEMSTPTGTRVHVWHPMRPDSYRDPARWARCSTELPATGKKLAQIIVHNLDAAHVRGCVSALRAEFPDHFDPHAYKRVA